MKNPSVHKARISALRNLTSSARKLALITGATSGIGKAFAEYFAAQDYDLVITGRRKSVIQPVAEELQRKYHIKVEVVLADLSRNDDITRLLHLISRYSNIEVLVNNAGYGMEQRFSEDQLEHQLAMLKVHVNAPLRLIHKVLPVMKANHSGIIINVSSLAANFPTAGNAMYTSSKSFLKNFTESLHLDLRHDGIRVQCLCPGFTITDFHRNHHLFLKNRQHDVMFWMRPSQVVKYSIHCLHKGQVICVPGFLNRILGFLAIAVPRNLYYLMVIKTERKINRQQHIPKMAFIQAVQGKTA